MDVLWSLLLTLYLVGFSDVFTLHFVFISVLILTREGFNTEGFFKTSIYNPYECSALNIVEELTQNFLAFKNSTYVAVPLT